MAKLLLVEDDAQLLEALQLSLELDKHSVDTARDADEAEFKIKSFDYDLLILDWQLPDKDGVDIIKNFRAAGGQTPILMLTGKKSAHDKEYSLDSGADDYLVKPFDYIELKARIRALLRRPSMPLASILNCHDIKLDPVKYLVSKSGSAVQLMPREYQLLEFLMRHPDQLFTQESLLNKVWPTDSDATTEALRTTLKRLRKKVDPEGKIIGTVYGAGIIMHSKLP